MDKIKTEAFFLTANVKRVTIGLTNSISVFPGGSVVKNLPANAGDPGSLPGSGRSPGRGYGNPFQYSCLGNPMTAAWQAIVHRVTELNTT